jgi:hypothetical protein
MTNRFLMIFLSSLLSINCCFRGRYLAIKNNEHFVSTNCFVLSECWIVLGEQEQKQMRQKKDMEDYKYSIVFEWRTHLDCLKHPTLGGLQSLCLMISQSKHSLEWPSTQHSHLYGD